jgi:hypothetical protein
MMQDFAATPDRHGCQIGNAAVSIYSNQRSNPLKTRAKPIRP